MPSFRRDPSCSRDIQESAEKIYNLLEVEALVKKRPRRRHIGCGGECQGGKDARRAEVSRLANAAGLTGPAQQHDTEIAHLTPGEIVVPLHAQTPAVIAALTAALGRSLPRFVVGSPTTQRNPVSGYSAFPGAVTPQSNSQPDLFSAVGAPTDFARNYQDMMSANTKDADKYFHCKANYEAARRGPIGAQMGEWLSDTREWYGQNIKGDPIVDSNADQIANRSGRIAGQLGIEPSARSACAYFRPRGLPSRY